MLFKLGRLDNFDLEGSLGDVDHHHNEVGGQVQFCRVQLRLKENFYFYIEIFYIEKRGRVNGFVKRMTLTEHCIDKGVTWD